MTSITIMYWNIQNFGEDGTYRGNYQPLCDFIAAAVGLAGVDLLFVQEVKAGAINQQRLQLLQRSLSNLLAPHNNWYYDWIKGGIRLSSQNPPVAPYNTENDLDWSSNHNEGYALFWNQNIAKFLMQAAPKIQIPGTGNQVANSQSGEVRTQGDHLNGQTAFGLAVGGNITVAAGTPQYALPAGTTAGANIVSGGGVVLAAGTTSGAAIPLNAGDNIPAGTTMGPAGLQLNQQLHQRCPVLVPGGYQNSQAFGLPAVGEVVLPQRALSLVITGRQVVNGEGANFNPAGANHWDYQKFYRGAGYSAQLFGARRVAYATLSVNSPALGTPAQELLPVLAYHAPVAQSAVAMALSSLSKPMYEAYDGTNWIANDRAVIGGDYNAKLKPTSYNYEAYTDGFGPAGGLSGGADCNNANGSCIRVNAPGGPSPSKNPPNRTTVQLKNPPTFGTPINSNNLDDYRFLAIDNAFYRGFSPLQSPQAAAGSVYDLLAAVTGGGGVPNIPGFVIQQFLTIPVFWDIANILAGNKLPPLPTTNGIQNAVQFASDLYAGIFQDPPAGPTHGVPPAARRAAEFIHLCVSDHLPVLFSMDL